MSQRSRYRRYLWVALCAAGCAGGSVAKGDKYRELGRCGAALAQYFPVLEDEPDNASVRFKVGSCLAEVGKCEEAIAHFRMVRKDPAYRFQALTSEANCHAQSDQHGAALEALEQALAEQPNNVGVLVKIGELRDRNGDLQGAREAFESAVDNGPENEVALLAMGRFYDLRLKEAARALDVFDRYLKVSTDSGSKETVRLRRRELLMTRPDLEVVDRARTQFKEGDYDGAVRSLQGAQLHGGDAYHLLGMAAWRSGDVQLAARSLREAVKRDAKNPMFLGDLISLLELVDAKDEVQALKAQGRRDFPDAEAFK